LQKYIKKAKIGEPERCTTTFQALSKQPELEVIMPEEIICSADKPKFDYSIPRICKKCGVLFSGRACKDCHNAAKRARRLANPEDVRQRAKTYYQVNKERINSYSSEYRSKNPEATRATKKRTVEKHKVAHSLKQKAYYLENKEKMLKKAFAYREKTKDKKRIAAHNYRKENPEKVKAAYAAWAKANPEANRVRVQNRRARKLANGGECSKGLVDKLLILQKGKCPCCGNSLGKDYHLDHIVPLARGGSNSDSNMQLLTKVCNMQKHAKDPVDFMQERGFLI
jgi:5-methylcytosine-specific restriction endonuclease McrA